MFSSALITFREALEAALVVGIVLSFLTKTNQNLFKKYVWYGVGAGIIISLLIAFSLEIIFGGFEGRTEQIFEGVLMFTTAGFLTWMILWVHRQKEVARKIKEKVKEHLNKGYGWGIFFLVSTAVFREGTETVLYLKATSLAGATNQLFGAFSGLVIALGLGYSIFKFAVRVKLDTLFNVTNIFLLLFAAGMVAHGVHEFQEVGIFPVYSFDPMINISHILDNDSLLGSILRTLFGYTAKPTFLELFSYGAYLLVIIWFERLSGALIKRKA